MPKHHSLTEVLTADKPARYSIDGRRVSKEAYEYLIRRASRHECFSTRAKQLPGGKFKRWNYSTVALD